MTSAALKGRKVLVTGASGFLGRRLVERLVAECGADVRVLVRTVMSAAPLARFPVGIVPGDLLDRRAVEQALDGCSLVFNCAKGKGADEARRRAVDVEGPRHLVEAARRAGASFVHVSTMAVYDRPDEGTFDEGAADAPRGDPYADAKLAGERAVLADGLRHGVPVAVVQPSIIYGPHGGSTIEMMGELRASRVILVNGGTGSCNLVYVDDVVSALLLAASHPAAAGQRFLVSGPEHVTWADFFGAFERMLGVSRTVGLSEREALRLWRRSRRRAWFAPEALRSLRDNPDLRARLLGTVEGAMARSVASHVLPRSVRDAARSTVSRGADGASAAELPIAAIRPWVIRNMARRARVSIDKARRVLGYEPVFTLERGMRLTEQWARWAGLIP